MQRKLDVVTSIAIIIVAAFLAITLLRQYSSRRNANAVASEEALSASLQPGALLAAPAGYRWQSHPRTLLLAIRYGCIHCERNMYIYQKMQHLADGKDTYLLSAFPDDSVVAQHDLDVHNLHTMPFIANVSFTQIKVAGTPTLILVNDQGTILRSWIGELSLQQQDEVMKAIQCHSNSNTCT